MGRMTAKKNKLIAFQGELGANGDLACRALQNGMETLPCYSFEDTFAAVRDKLASRALIPIENTVAGRVADIHHLLPNSGLFIVGEHFQRVEHHLLVIKGTTIDQLSHVHSHVHALNQCRNTINDLELEPVVHVDTAGAAKDIAERGDPCHAAIASQLAGQIYGLDSIRANIEDAQHNTTRFLLMAPEPLSFQAEEPNLITSFIFRVRNVPAALYKALGGFASNGVNMLKLESYLFGGGFVAAQFYVEVEGHPDSKSLSLALEELSFFTHEVRTLGVYQRNSIRDSLGENGS